MVGWNILLRARLPVESSTFKPTPSLGLRSVGLYFLGTCYPVYQWRIEFSVPLLSSSQLQSYLVPCISARIIIIPKLQNIRCNKFPGELFSLCFEHLPNCYSTSNIIPRAGPDFVREHLSPALPSERIFYLLRAIHLYRLIHYPELMPDILEIIIKWLQVSC